MTTLHHHALRVAQFRPRCDDDESTARRFADLSLEQKADALRRYIAVFGVNVFDGIAFDELERHAAELIDRAAAEGRFEY